MFLKPRQFQPQDVYKVYSTKKKEKKRVHKNNSEAVNQCNAVIAGGAHYFLHSFKANHANKVTLIITHMSLLSSAIQQCMENESSRATAIVIITLPIVAY